jgi:hypothetical protein
MEMSPRLVCSVTRIGEMDSLIELETLADPAHNVKCN